MTLSYIAAKSLSEVIIASSVILIVEVSIIVMLSVISLVLSDDVNTSTSPERVNPSSKGSHPVLAGVPAGASYPLLSP